MLFAPPSKVGDLSEPTTRRVCGELVADSLVTGPFTGNRAAAFLVQLGEHHEETAVEVHSPAVETSEHFEVLGEQVLAAPLKVQVDDGIVHINPHDLKLSIPTSPGGVTTVTSPLPKMFERFAGQPVRNGVRAFRELSLSNGDPVELRATLAPTGIPNEWKATSATLVDLSVQARKVVVTPGMVKLGIIVVLVLLVALVNIAGGC